MQLGCRLLIKTLLIRFSRCLPGFICCSRGFVFLYCHTKAHWLNRRTSLVELQTGTQSGNFCYGHNSTEDTGLDKRQQRTRDLTKDTTEDTGLDRFTEVTYRTLRCLRPLKSILLMIVRLFPFRSLEPSGNSGQRTGHETLVSAEKIMTIVMYSVGKCREKFKHTNSSYTKICQM